MTPMPLSVNVGLPKNVAWPGHSVYTAPSRAPTSSWTCKAWAARHSPALTRVLMVFPGGASGHSHASLYRHEGW
jgi:hypothetical protein